MWRVRKQEDLYVFLDEDAKDIEIGYGMFIEEKDLEQLYENYPKYRHTRIDFKPFLFLRHISLLSVNMKLYKDLNIIDNNGL